MITVTVIGLDPYMVRQISKDLSEKLADIYECLTSTSVRLTILTFTPQNVYIFIMVLNKTHGTFWSK